MFALAYKYLGPNRENFSFCDLFFLYITTSLVFLERKERKSDDTKVLLNNVISTPSVFIFKQSVSICTYSFFPSCIVEAWIENGHTKTPNSRDLFCVRVFLMFNDFRRKAWSACVVRFPKESWIP